MADNQARLGVFTGDVQLLTQGAADWIDAHEALPLETGDRIRTGEDGETELIVANHVLWKLGPGSQMVAEHMESNAGRFQLESGGLIGKADSAASGTAQRWEIDTPTSICAIRDTEFILRVPKTAETRLAVLEGSVEMQPAETAIGETQAVHVHAGEEGVAVRGKAVSVRRGFSKLLQPWLGQRAAFRKAAARVEQTWTPFTDEVRQEIRQKFVPPALKHPPRPTARRRKA